MTYTVKRIDHHPQPFYDLYCEEDAKWEATFGSDADFANRVCRLLNADNSPAPTPVKLKYRVKPIHNPLPMFDLCVDGEFAANFADQELAQKACDLLAADDAAMPRP